MSDTKQVEFSLKVMINKQKTKVLFAEIDSNLADVLISFLTLPLGKIARVLKKHYGEDKSSPIKIGSITSLYDGLSNLDSDYFWTDSYKELVLNPRSSFEYECHRLKLDINDTHLNKYFCCEDPCCVHPRYSNISMHYDIVSCKCGKSLNREVGIRISSSDDDDDDDDGGFVINKESFLISDDLRIVTNMAGSVLETLTYLGITEMDGAELRIVTFGFNEIIDLLEWSLISPAPLTDLILPYRSWQMESAVAKSEPGNFIHEMGKEADSNFKKMVLKVMVQKSTNKLLFAQSKDDFVDFLCTLLTLPLGGVGYLLGGKTCLITIDNLYTSLADNLLDDDSLANSNIKVRLMKPKVPHGYMSRIRILPLSEQTDPRLYYHKGLGQDEEWLSYSSGDTKTPHAINYRNDVGFYVSGPKMFMVADNLTVTPLNMMSCFSVLNRLKIPLSDVKEVEVPVGLQEGLSILRASLTSTCALTNGLMIYHVPELNVEETT